MSISTSFRPKLVLGVNVLGVGRGGIGAFIDLPQIGVSIAQVRDVNSKCERSVSKKANAGLDEIFDSNLTHIVPTAAIQIGVEAGWNVAALKPNSAEITFFSTQAPLPTLCLSYDADRKALVTPTPVGTNSGAATASANQKGNGVRSLSLPKVTTAWLMGWSCVPFFFSLGSRFRRTADLISWDERYYLSIHSHQPQFIHSVISHCFFDCDSKPWGLRKEVPSLRIFEKQRFSNPSRIFFHCKINPIKTSEHLNQSINQSN